MGKLQFDLITKKDESNDFDCGNPKINESIRESYYAMLTQQAYTYRVYEKGKEDMVLGYIQYYFLDINLTAFPSDVSDLDSGIKSNFLTAVHINYLAINKKYQGRGIGGAVLKTIVRKIEKLVENWPVSVITIAAKEELVSWYKKFGFNELTKNFEGQTGYNIAMYYDCLSKQDELSAYLEEASQR